MPRVLSRVVFLAVVVALSGAAGFVTYRWARPLEPETPRPEPSPPVPAPLALPNAPAGDEYAGLEPADAATLARVWLLHGDTAERARASAALARLGASAPAPAAATPIAQSNSARDAWEHVAARRRGVDETLDPSIPEHQRAIETLRARWASEIRASLPALTLASGRSEPGAERSASRLALARLADEAGDRRALVAALASLSDDAGEEARVAATWLATVHLADGDIERAAEAVARVRDVFDGQGLDARGRPVPALVLADALAARAIEGARAAVEGAAPDVARAKRLLAIARPVADSVSAVSATIDLEAAGRYIALSDVPLDVGPLQSRLASVAGPCVVVLADDFQLGEPVLPSVLRRWSKGLPVVLVGRLTGKIRLGIRRVHASSATEERTAFSAHATAAGLDVAGFVEGGGDEETRLGLHAGVGAVVFVLDRDRRVVGRVSGTTLDPRPLDPVVLRLVPDPSVIAPPDGGPK